MSRILVLGGSGEMGSAAVADLVERTDHEVTIGDIRPEAASALLRRLGAPDRVVRSTSTIRRRSRAALADTDVVLNATYMRHNVPVTDAAIAAGVAPGRSRLVLPGDAPAARARTPRGRQPAAASCRAAAWRPA